jgi:superfamily II DNA helicase RecQ
VPPYVVLTNRQLTAIVLARPATPNALLAVDGFGPGKVERYGAAILAKMNGHPLAAAAPAVPEPAAAVVAEPSS